VKTSTFDSYRRFAGYLTGDIGGFFVVQVGAETITAWPSELLDRNAPFTDCWCFDDRCSVLRDVRAGGLLNAALRCRLVVRAVCRASPGLFRLRAAAACVIS